MGKNRKKLTEPSQNFLDVVPVQNNNWEKTGDGRAYLLVPRFRNRLMKKIMTKMGKSEFVKVFFDQTGTEVWQLIDGTSTVEQIGQKIVNQNNESEEQKYQRLSQFISILARNRFVNLKNFQEKSDVSLASPPPV